MKGLEFDKYILSRLFAWKNQDCICRKMLKRYLDGEDCIIENVPKPFVEGTSDFSLYVGSDPDDEKERMVWYLYKNDEANAEDAIKIYHCPFCGEKLYD